MKTNAGVSPTNKRSRPKRGALLRLSLIVLASMGTSACYLNASGKALERQVNTIEARQNEFMATFDSDRTRLTELSLRAEQRILELEVALNNAQEFLQRNNADLGAHVQLLGTQINELRGRMEELQHQNNLLREEIELLRQEMDIRMNALMETGR